jgi:hypothetical protein
MKNHEIFAIMTAIALMFIIGVSAVPQTNTVWTQPGWGNFQPVPIMLKDIGIYDAKPGDIVYADNGPTYVAIDSQRALYLDFNVAPRVYVPDQPAIPLEEIEVYAYDDPRTTMAEYYEVGYRIVGHVDENIMNIITPPEQLVTVIMTTRAEPGKWIVNTQFKIWAYLGVDEEAMKIIWEQAYARTGVEWNFILPTLQLYKNMGKQIQANVLEPQDLYLRFTPHGYSRMTVYALNSECGRNVALNINLGTRFANAGGTNQDLGAGEPVTVYVPTGMSKTFELKTYCLNAHKGVPAMGDALSPTEIVDDNIRDVMKEAFAGGQASTSESQSAVWQQTG